MLYVHLNLSSSKSDIRMHTTINRGIDLSLHENYWHEIDINWIWCRRWSRANQFEIAYTLGIYTPSIHRIRPYIFYTPVKCFQCNCIMIEFRNIICEWIRVVDMTGVGCIGNRAPPNKPKLIPMKLEKFRFD